MGALSELARHVRLLCGPLETQVVRIDGALRSSQRALQARYCGTGASLPFLCKLLFADCRQQLLRIDHLPALSNGRAFTDLDRRRADITIIERPPAWQLLSFGAADISVPAWVQQVIELPAASGDGGPALPRLLMREVARHERRSGFALDYTDDPAAKREFFHRLYEPYVAQRFGEGAVRVSEAFFLHRARDQELARLRCNGEWIAGVLLHRHELTLRFGWFGALPGPTVPGASEVLDALIIERAAREGVKTVQFGNSRPSLEDGVVRYKRRFGAKVRAARFPQAMINLYVHQWSPPLAQRLNDAQLIGTRRSAPFVHRIVERDGRFSVEHAPLAAAEATAQ